VASPGNFAKLTAFIEETFDDVKGRLYPAFGIGGSGVEVTVNFGQQDFLFKDLL
jgi:hypothetical protein